MRAEDVGWAANKIVLGKLSGRNAFKQRLQELGVALESEAAINTAFASFKELADRKSEIFDEDILALVQMEGAKTAKDIFDFVSLSQHSETGEPPHAEVVFQHQGQEVKVCALGNGPVDACFKAIESHVNSGAEMLLFSINAISTSPESQGEVAVRLQRAGRVVNGVGADPDIVVASAKAYLNALNRFVYPQRKCGGTGRGRHIIFSRAAACGTSHFSWGDDGFRELCDGACQAGRNTGDRAQARQVLAMVVLGGGAVGPQRLCGKNQDCCLRSGSGQKSFGPKASGKKVATQRATAKKAAAKTPARRKAAVAKAAKRPTGRRAAVAKAAAAGMAVAAVARPSFAQLAGLDKVSDPLALESSVALVIDQDTKEVLLSKRAGRVAHCLDLQTHDRFGGGQRPAAFG